METSLGPKSDAKKGKKHKTGYLQKKPQKTRSRHFLPDSPKLPPKDAKVKKKQVF